MLLRFLRTMKSMGMAALVALHLVAWTPSGAAEASLRDSLSLDGTWQIVFDRENAGKAGGWFVDKQFPEGKARAIPVPSCWELTEKDYEGVAFYRHAFTVPAAWKGRVVRLHFDAVNFAAEVWLNGQAVGCHEGGFTPFDFRVDEMIRPGAENVLTVRVAGPILLQDRRIDGVGPMETPQWRGAITGGIWQSVRLVATGDAYVEDVFIEPKIADDSVTFHLELVHAGRKARSARVGIAVRSDRKPDAVVAGIETEFDLKPGTTRRRSTIRLKDATSWSPDDPHLYRAEVRVTCDDTLSDRWEARFGMREFTIRDGRFCLNGKPLYLKATFFEGLYPVKLAYPDSREMAAREIRLAKEAGFNMIRPWRKPPPPMWLDLAEEMGVLTVGSLVVECMDYPVESARLPAWVENEVRESILRDRNRASVVQWELFNELKRPVLKQMLHPMSMLARRLDPTRMILDESGGWAHGANLYLPYESEPTPFNDIHDYPGPFINEEVYTKLMLAGVKTHPEMRAMGLKGRLPGRNVVPGLMTYFSELGYGSLPDLVDNNRRFTEVGNPIAPPTLYHKRLADGHVRALKESGLDRVYPDLKKFCLDQQRLHGAANRRMMEAVRCNPNVNGYCIHALTAGDWIMGAALIDLFRNPKGPVYEETKAANRPRILSIRVRPRNVYAGRGTRIEIMGVNEMKAVGGTLSVLVVSPDGTVVFKKELKVDLKPGITPLFKEPLDTKALRGTCLVKVKIASADGALVTENAHAFDVFTAEQLAAPEKRIAVFDPTRSLTPFLKRSGIAFEEFTAGIDRALPVFVSRTVAKTPEQRKRFQEIAGFIKAGGTAVYLQGGGPWFRWGLGAKSSPLLPVTARQRMSKGNWNGISHIVVDHPFFRGLPVDCMMGPVYENVWAESTLIGLDVKPVVGAVGFDWFPDFDLSRRHYYGPGDTWWGADVAIVPLGTGRCIVSQLRLVDNLGKDPVADRILYNMIEFTARGKAD